MPGVRRRVVAATVVVAALSATAGWVAARRIQSPAEAAARAKPPAASLITVPVESRQLSSNVITRGQVRFEESTDIRLVASSGSSTSLVTKPPPEAGSSLREGDLLIEVGSRPVFVLEGELPAYRDLVPGASGDDVRQLEAALARLGFDPGPVDSRYDAATQQAVSAFYQKRGYEARRPSTEQRTRLDNAEKAVDAAADRARQAAKALAEAEAGVPASRRLELDSQVRTAEDHLAAARAGATKAQAEADAAVAKANAATETARAELNAASSERKAEAQAKLAAAEADLALARAASAEVGTNQASLVRQASDALAVVTAQRSEALAERDTTAERRAVTDADQALTAAQADLAQVNAEVGISVPQAELVFLRSLPRRIDSVAARRGEPVGDKIVTVSGAAVVIDATVSAADRRLVKVGAKVNLDEDSLGLHFAGSVTFVADQPGTSADAGSGGSGSGSGSGGGGGGSSGVGGGGTGGGTGSKASDRYAVRVQPTTLPTGQGAADLRGINVRVSIPVESTTGRVLAVPVAALSAGGDGSARVQVQNADGSVRLVTVALGLSAQGFTEVTPLNGAALAAGDRVVVGESQAPSSAAGDTSSPAAAGSPSGGKSG